MTTGIVEVLLIISICVIGITLNIFGARKNNSLLQNLGIFLTMIGVVVTAIFATN